MGVKKEERREGRDWEGRKRVEEKDGMKGEKREEMEQEKLMNAFNGSAKLNAV